MKVQFLTWICQLQISFMTDKYPRPYFQRCYAFSQKLKPIWSKWHMAYDLIRIDIWVWFGGWGSFGVKAKSVSKSIFPMFWSLTQELLDQLNLIVDFWVSWNVICNIRCTHYLSQSVLIFERTSITSQNGSWDTLCPCKHYELIKYYRMFAFSFRQCPCTGPHQLHTAHVRTFS